MSNYNQLDELYRTGERVKVDRDWSEYPINTIAPAVMGGYWHRVERGWKWCTGDTFPGPDADNTGMVILPSDPNAAYNAKVREIAEELAKIDWKVHDKSYDKGRPWETLLPMQQDGLIGSQDASARAMVAEMAKTFEQAYFLNLLHDPSDPVFNVWHEQCDRIMQERGLIPNTKTDNDAV